MFLQVLVMASLERQRNTPVGPSFTRLEERSVYSAHEVFQKVLVQRGALSKESAYCLSFSFKEIAARMPLPDGIIYIR